MANARTSGGWACAYAKASAIPVVPTPRLRCDEHIAELASPGQFESLHRKNGFFDEGVGTIFGLKRGEVELQAFCFQSSQFTPAQARDWLRKRGFEPCLFTAGRVR
jgi:hypothetical protein